ncbi:MAG TPA: hypothetical protein VGS16_13665 [Candidatus Dormibacteraeota bacterium]|nr:hypothetical protein [Candidatus Dormibacteraeota bacterium]
MRHNSPSSSYAYRVRFDARAHEVRINDPVATAEVWVGVTSGLPTTLDVYPIFNANGGNEEPSQLTVKVLPYVWDHNSGRTKRFMAELVRAMYEVNHQPLTRALKQAVTKKAMNRSGWSTPEQEAMRLAAESPNTEMRLATLQKQTASETPPQPAPDRFGELLERMGEIANRPIEVNVAPPSVTIAEGAVHVTFSNPKPGDLEIQFPDGRKTKVRRT